jgi:hypothetical protein
MKRLLVSFCVVAIATFPTASGANMESEAASAEPIVIAYIPEHLQDRVPGHQHAHQTSPELELQGTTLEQQFAMRWLFRA